jgi:hypothetical protein
MIITTYSAAAQQDDWRLYKSDSSKVREMSENPRYSSEQMTTKRPQYHKPGKVSVSANRRIELVDSLKKIHPTALEGYRVQLFFGSRDDAQKMRGEFLKQHPETGAYISYLAPNFRLRVGDFRSKMECERLKKMIQQDFPASYIVRDKINMPALREGEKPVEQEVAED